MQVGKVDLLPRYEPYVGKRFYENSYTAPGLPDRGFEHPFTHVMGESHYSDDYADDASLTKNVIRDWAFERSRGGAFFTKVACIQEQCRAAELDRPAAWAKLAYSNFVQQMLGASRVAPDENMWEEGRRSFFGQLAIVRTKVLLVLGKRLWQQLPSEVGEKAPPLQVRADWPIVDDAWIYPFEHDGTNRIVLAVHIPHPSSSKFNLAEAQMRLVTAHALYSNLAMTTLDELSGN